MAAIFAGVRGYLDHVKPADVIRFQDAALADLRAKHQDLLDKIRTDAKLTDETDKALGDFYEQFAKTFA